MDIYNLGDVMETVEAVSVIKRIISLLCAGVFMFLFIVVYDFLDIPINEIGRKSSLIPIFLDIPVDEIGITSSQIPIFSILPLMKSEEKEL